MTDTLTTSVNDQKRRYCPENLQKAHETNRKRYLERKQAREERLRELAEIEGDPPAPLTSETEFTEAELLGSLCQDSFFDFVKTFWPVVVHEKPVWNWHIEFLAQELQDIAERVFKGLPLLADTTVNISPGSTKTLLMAIMFPAWIWTRMPHARILNASYSHDIAMDSSSKSRDVIKNDLYRRLFPEIKIRDDTDAKSHFINTHGGERYAFGVGGAVTGKHAHFIIVDDPLNPEQSASDAELSKANRWMERTLPSRKVDKKVTPTILVMQRLHQNDPTGVRLEKAKQGLKHNHVCLPAELTDDVQPAYCRRYYIDGLMDPVRLDAEVLAHIELEQGDFVFAAQFLQTPIPEGTAMFHVHKLRPGTPPKVFKSKCRAWDKASTFGGGCYTVGTLMGLDLEGRYWVLDVVRDRLDSSARERLIKRTAEKDGKSVFIAVEQEPGSGGKHSAQFTSRNLAGFRVMVVPVGKADGDKANRAYPFSTQVNNDNVSIIKAEWNQPWINELRYFPNSRTKDQVDSASLAFNVLANKRRRLGGRAVLPSASRP